jgi:hypothetical protein
MYPALSLVGTAGALLVAGPWKPGRPLDLALVTVLFAVAWTVDGRPSLVHVRQARDPRFAVAAREVVDSGARVVSGNYWTAWPLVFDANAELYRRGSRHQVYGLTYRSTPTDERWRTRTPLLIAAPIGDEEVWGDARALGLGLKLVEHRSLIDVFAADGDPAR